MPTIADDSKQGSHLTAEAIKLIFEILVSQNDLKKAMDIIATSLAVYLNNELDISGPLNPEYYYQQAMNALKDAVIYGIKEIKESTNANPRSLQI